MGILNKIRPDDNRENNGVISIVLGSIAVIGFTIYTLTSQQSLWEVLASKNAFLIPNGIFFLIALIILIGGIYQFKKSKN